MPFLTAVSTDSFPLVSVHQDLIYRGDLYRVDPSLTKPTSSKPRSYELICRGYTYQVTRNEAGEMIAMGPATKRSKGSPLPPQAMPKAVDKQLR